MERPKGDLDQLPRDELIARARQLGLERPEVMTRVELKDEIIRRITTDETSRRRARGWLGVARDLVASLIEQGLNMPDAAKLVRSGVTPTRIRHQPPVATVTLAEIYAAQGHVSRALSMLDEVLAKEPDHAAARSLSERLRRDKAKRETPKPDPEPEPEPEPRPSDLPEPLTPRVIVHRDALVTILTDDGAAWVYWELAARSLARARARWPSGRATIQLVALIPRWEGARRFEREIPAEPSSGAALIPPYGEHAVVRAAIGWRDAAGFHPIAVGTELAPPNGPGGSSRVRWAPSARTVVDVPTQERALARFVATRAS